MCAASMTTRSTREAVGRVAGSPVVAMRPLSGGCVGEVYRIDLEDGARVVAKVDSSGSGGLAIEGFMLRYLAERSRLPVPAVLHADDGLLVMEHVEHDGPADADAQRHAADLLAGLHAIGSDKGYGLERDTVIGGLPQPNGWSASWVSFYAERRLAEMARQAERAGRVDAGLRRRVETLAARLGDFLEEPSAPSLIHGDVWGGNVLARPGRIAAFIDPAIYYADADVELAFIDWLSCFGRPFWERYAEHRPIREGFFNGRRIVYQLYPQLVHARLFGGGYVDEVARGLRALGF